MSELTVYFCPHCGYYGYYQISKNAMCPKCKLQMTPHPMRFQKFMNLSCPERDELLSQEILKLNPSIVSRITAPHKIYNNREIIGVLSRRIEELESENKKLNDTVAWMHETIWDLLNKKRQLDAEILEIVKSS